MTIMETMDIYWLSGILEGEGSFVSPLSKGIPYPLIRVEMKDRDIIDRLQNLTGVGTVRESTRPSRPDHWSPVYTWSVNKGKDVARILLAVYPLMGDRRKEQISEIVIDLVGAKRTRSDKGKKRHDINK